MIKSNGEAKHIRKYRKEHELKFIDNLVGTIVINEYLCKRIIDSHEFIRLGRLRMGGFRYLVYPNAFSSRLAHSVGTYYYGNYTLSHLVNNMNPDWKNHFLACCLLHDIGHFPFSHVLEPLFKNYEISHEKLTYEIIEKGSIETYKMDNIEIPLTLSDVFEEEDCNVDKSILISICRGTLKDKKYLENNGIPTFLPMLISGDIDIDRFDHITRDSYEIGYDFRFLPREIISKFKIFGSELTVAQEGVPHILLQLLLRENLYQFIYDNKDIRSFESLISEIVSNLLTFIESKNEKKQFLLKIGFLTDEELLNFLSEGELRKYELYIENYVSYIEYNRLKEYIDDLMKRLYYRMPYELVKKYTLVELQQKGVDVDDLRKLLNEVKEKHSGTPFLFYLPKQPTVRELHINILNGEKEKPLSEISSIAKGIAENIRSRWAFFVFAPIDKKKDVSNILHEEIFI